MPPKIIYEALDADIHQIYPEDPNSMKVKIYLLRLEIVT